MNKSFLAQWRRQRSSGATGLTRCGNTTFQWGERTYIMGIVNTSPESFSGDGLDSVYRAVTQARHFIEEGADIIDVGGESTRPGTKPSSDDLATEQELSRVIPVLERLVREIDAPVSIDTYRYAVARQALDTGVHIINDIWGLQREPRLAELAAERNAPLIMMSNQREKPGRYIMPVIIADLKRAVDTALDAGVPWDNIIIDPGPGFGKTLEQNYEIVRRLGELKAFGLPVLLGTSRKSMIGLTLDLPPDQRVEGTAATVALGIANGADIVRVHDVKEMVRVCRMTDAIVRRGRKR
ncbi:MAG: dihydropteroate synthase [Dehalococcoidia bacterium]